MFFSKWPQVVVAISWVAGGCRPPSRPITPVDRGIMPGVSGVNRFGLTQGGGTQTLPFDEPWDPGAESALPQGPVADFAAQSGVLPVPGAYTFGDARRTHGNPMLISFSQDAKAWEGFFLAYAPLWRYNVLNAEKCTPDGEGAVAAGCNGYVFKSLPVNEPGQGFQFSCPQSMILVGEDSQFDGYLDSFDRIYRYNCAHLQTLQGNLLRRRSCTWSEFQKNDVDYTCPNDTFMSGVRSHTYSLDNSRDFSFQCCSYEAKTPAGSSAPVTVQNWIDGFYPEEGVVPMCANESNGRYLFYGNPTPLLEYAFIDRNNFAQPYPETFVCADGALTSPDPRDKFDVNSAKFGSIPFGVLRRIRRRYSAADRDYTMSYFCCRAAMGPPLDADQIKELHAPFDDYAQQTGNEFPQYQRTH